MPKTFFFELNVKTSVGVWVFRLPLTFVETGTFYPNAVDLLVEPSTDVSAPGVLLMSYESYGTGKSPSKPRRGRPSRLVTGSSHPLSTAGVRLERGDPTGRSLATREELHVSLQQVGRGVQETEGGGRCGEMCVV